MLKLIYGTSGSGKTTAILNRICEDIRHGIPCYLLIPEQQAYVSERELLDTLPANAGLFFEVVNFSKLAEGVFRRYGGAAQTSAGNGIRSVLVWETLRSLSPMLKQYGKTKADTALTAEMYATLLELQNNGVTSDQLEEAALELPENVPLRRKLSDLALIQAVYSEKAQVSCGMAASDRLIRAADLSLEKQAFRGYHIYVDSFAGFTAPEFTLLEALLRQAEAVTVSLCTDALSSKLIHFESVSRTASRLIRMAKDCGTEIFTEKIDYISPEKPEELRILERELWDFQLTKNMRTLPKKDAPAVIHTSVCPNLYEESELCVVQILDLVQKGLRYEDIAIVVRETDTYRGVLDAALERYGIPYFLSERTDLASKPLSRLILSALRAVSQNYRSQDILTLLKTGISGADLRDVALFEEYCETWHISGKRFTDEIWSMNPDGLTEQRSKRAEKILLAANRVRKTVMDPLLKLQASMRASRKMPDLCRSVYEYLQELKISEQLSEHAKKELSLGQHREAGETLRLYRFILDTLTELSELLPDSELTSEEFLSVLTLYFSVTDLGSVPSVHDCVVIGSASMLRVERVKASFLLGLCEGEFPKSITDTGLLTEADKLAMESLGITLDSGQKLRSSEELLYVYRAMTKPSEQLFLSHPALQPDGSQRTPSLAFNRIKFLFDRQPKVFQTAMLREDDPKNAEESEAHHRLPAMEGHPRLHLTQSRIQAFVLCPYRYYSTYRLKLRSKKDSRISAADEGTFLHFVLEKFLKGCLSEDGSLCFPSFESLPARADAVIYDYLQRVCPIPPEEMDSRLLHLFERLRGLTLLALQDVVGQLSSGAFRPVGFEMRMGGNEENAIPAPRLNLRDGGTVELGGTVDRVDLFEQDDKLYIRVVDYKTGEHKFDFEKVRSGEDLQLVLYLFAVIQSDPDKYVPCGAEFLYTNKDKGKTTVSRSGFLLKDDAIQHAADGLEGQPYLKSIKPIDSHELEALTEDMENAIRSVAERILAGEAQKTPSPDACRFCPVIDHCDRACHEKK